MSPPISYENVYLDARPPLACEVHVRHSPCMPTVQIRNVPEETSRALKAKAALEGRSLSDYLLGELRRIADRPSRAELLARIAARGSATCPRRRTCSPSSGPAEGGDQRAHGERAASPDAGDHPRRDGGAQQHGQAGGWQWARPSASRNPDGP